MDFDFCATEDRFAYVISITSEGQTIPVAVMADTTQEKAVAFAKGYELASGVDVIVSLVPSV